MFTSRFVGTDCRYYTELLKAKQRRLVRPSSSLASLPHEEGK
jgi:hypothetical protein